MHNRREPRVVQSASSAAVARASYGRGKRRGEEKRRTLKPPCELAMMHSRLRKRASQMLSRSMQQISGEEVVTATEVVQKDRARCDRIPSSRYYREVVLVHLSDAR